MAQNESIRFNNVTVAGRPLEATRLSGWWDIVRHARGVERLVRVAYARTFEGDGRPWETDTVRRHLANEYSPFKVVARAIRMRKHMESGSQYWVVADPTQPGYLLSMAKTTPAQREDCNVYVNDVLAETPGRLYGAVALRAALHGQAGGVCLDAFAGNDPANHWFERMGLKPTALHPGSYDIAPEVQPLDQVSYVGATAAAMCAYLDRRHPQLGYTTHIPGA